METLKQAVYNRYAVGYGGKGYHEYLNLRLSMSDVEVSCTKSVMYQQTEVYR